eukprot:TRINITY_DN1235_c0_g1_i1.p1 TRINITY_DN1235_c0_g1~~TRINITY_DN1235_c0_g1_i1.p1  ORF type:complete len:457 (-),score=41.60 TRINITY_DN1235_c0_g1_i1:766-2136(-)
MRCREVDHLGVVPKSHCSQNWNCSNRIVFFSRQRLLGVWERTTSPLRQQARRLFQVDQQLILDVNRKFHSRQSQRTTSIHRRFPPRKSSSSLMDSFQIFNHYGTEPVCALNDLKVYGLTEGQMLENRLLHLHKVTQIIDDQQQQQQQQLLQNEEIPSQTNGQVADESDNTSVEEEPVVITQIVQVDTGGQTQCDVDRIIFGNDSDTNLTCCNIDVCFPQDEMVEVRKTLADSSQETSTQPPNEEQKQPQMEFPKTLENTLFMNTPKPVQGHIQGSVYDKIINEMISLKLNQTYTWKQNQEMSESINNLQKTVEVLNQSLSVQIEQRQQEASQQRDQTMKLQQVTNQQSIQLAELNLHIEQLETKYQNLMQIIENQEQQGQQILNISRIMLGVVVGVGLMVLPWVSFEPKVVWLLFIASVGVIGVLITMRMALAEGWQATTLKAALSCVNHCLAKRS